MYMFFYLKEMINLFFLYFFICFYLNFIIFVYFMIFNFDVVNRIEKINYIVQKSSLNFIVSGFFYYYLF